MKWNEIKEIARKLRNTTTEFEALLWQEIRGRKLMGRKFLRQHPIIYETNRDKNDFFFFIPDFYCAQERLIIELDGLIHDFQKDKDYHRELILLSNNLRVIRFKNDELDNIEEVKMRIISLFNI